MSACCHCGGHEFVPQGPVWSLPCPVCNPDGRLPEDARTDLDGVTFRAYLAQSGDDAPRPGSTLAEILTVDIPALCREVRALRDALAWTKGARP